MAHTVLTLQQYKQQAHKIVAVTAWDYLLAQILDQAGVDLILVGDSLGMVALGYETTLPVTLTEMIHHAKAVRRGVKHAFLVCDLPFLSYQVNPELALHNAGQILKETGVQAVKLEGGYPTLLPTVQRLVQAGIPVMGHVGLLPQAVHRLGGYRQQGKTTEAAAEVFHQAFALQEAGIFALLLEHIPGELARDITQKLTIPTIGIGAGTDCDGQILVTADLLGLTAQPPPFAPPYANLRQQITQAVADYSQTVRGQA
ncbi:3-methyl-2-oxobutanoate hydroxymethyltransferase [Gloeomargarita lithophora Alchichica-D10]|uniref:3-methyl-2-oxobutanoate hydroxymethyltransferase n=1 Tax=Gloeomargarita lithophora Alchichica-D10 TaxID=1188229 RepID=A0A1J0ADZ5_9CYAN|nr:3-methyl-2-oxobutanoate hydroxymethyltransferase [Gloeomargarita lithophora]APB34166.1 3-methyl-2-oxobutanoate hydroxymethyltransferase [Gloeomargarita lithophora Alchichica-D10]